MTVPTDEEVLAAWNAAKDAQALALAKEDALATATQENRDAAIAASEARNALRALVFPEAT